MGRLRVWGARGVPSLKWPVIGVLFASALPSVSAARPVMLLDGTWQFRLDTGGDADRYVEPLPTSKYPGHIRVPGCWDAQGFGKPTDRMRHHGIGVGWYRRTFTVPQTWRGKRLWLRVGGAHRSARVWVDGSFVGEHWGYPTAFKLEVTEVLSADQQHSLILAVDSRRHPERDPLTGSFDLIDYMDIDWGGIFDSVCLEATGGVWVEDVFVVPDPAQGCSTVKLTLGGDDLPTGLEARYEVRRWKEGSGTLPACASGRRALSARESSFTLTLAGAPRWSPDSPNLLNLRLSLVLGKRTLDDCDARFGLRRVEVRGSDFFLNGQRFFLRGYGDDDTLPLAISPPADRDYWRRYLSLRKQFGFVGVRHHSMMPPEAYLTAADEVGIFIQPELPIAYEPFYTNSTEAGKELYRQVWRDYIRQMRNHPSVFAWCMGNEMGNGFPLGPELYDAAKSLDPTRPAIDTDGVSLINRPTLDYLSIQFDEWSIPWGARRGKYRLDAPAPKPVIVHEMSNLSVLPDPATVDRYTGPILPFWLEAMRRKIAERNLTSYLPDMLSASRRLQARLLKLNLEAARLSSETDGYYQWLFRDYWTQSSGFVDQFDALRQVTPAFALQFNAPAVLLLDAERVTFRSGELIPIRLFLSDFREHVGGPWKAVRIRLGDRDVPLTPPAKRSGPGLIGPWTGSVAAPAVAQPVQRRLAGTAGAIRNDWPVWVFPPASPQVSDSDRGLIIGQLSEESLTELEQGAARLLVNAEGVFPTLPTRFKTAWWKGDDGDHSYGHLVVQHPAMQGFPDDGCGDLGMDSLMQDRPVALLDQMPGHLNPIVWDLDVPWQMRRKAFLFETRVGAGKLLVCTLNLSRQNRSTDPAAAWLLQHLLTYVRSGKFRPAGELPANWLRDRLVAIQRPDPKTLVNGFARVVEGTESSQTWYSYRENDVSSIAVRQTDGKQSLMWETAPVPADWPRETVTFMWTGGMGWVSEPGGGHFTLSLNGKRVLDFPFTQQTTRWVSEDGGVRFHYVVRRFLGVDSFGLFYLEAPRASLVRGEAARITVTATARNSRRWFGLNPYTDTLEYEAGY